MIDTYYVSNFVIIILRNVLLYSEYNIIKFNFNNNNIIIRVILNIICNRVTVANTVIIIQPLF